MSLPNNKLTIITDNPICANGAVENSDASYSTSVVSGGLLTLPDSQINVNGVDEGDIISVKTVDVNIEDSLGDPVTPTSVALVGNTLTIEVPSGGGSYDLDLVDRFGNAFPTKQVTANATWDLRTLTPYDFADLYLSRLLTPPSSTIENAIIQFYDDLITADIFQTTGAFYIAITTSPDDNKWNLRYPFDNVNSAKLNFIGSPSHTASGIEITGTAQAAMANITPQALEDNDKMISMYINQSITNTSETSAKFYMGTGSGNDGFLMTCHASVTGSINICNDSFRTSQGSMNLSNTNRNGLWSLGYNASVRNLRRDGNNIILNGNAVDSNFGDRISFGSVTGFNGILVSNSPIGVRFPYMRVGSYLAGTKETDHYNAVLTFLTTLGIN